MNWSVTVAMILCLFSGIFFVLPCIEDYTKIDLRTVTFDIPPQEVSFVKCHWVKGSNNDSLPTYHICASNLFIFIFLLSTGHGLVANGLGSLDINVNRTESGCMCVCVCVCVCSGQKMEE